MTRLARLAARVLPDRPFTGPELQAEADRRTGLQDPHPEQVTEPLDRIALDLAERPPSALGRLLLRTLLLDALCTRRHVLRLPDRRPTAPLVVVGWYRTGTSALQARLGGLEGYGWVPLHRLVNPILGGRWRTAAGVALMARIAPEVARLHPVRATGPEECWPLLAAHLVVEGLAFHYHLPRYFAWLRQVDRRPAYRCWARTCAWLESELGHRLVLKDPAHLLALPALLEAVPDARLVWTHRDLATCVRSYARITMAQHRAVYGRVDWRRAGRVTADRTLRGVTAGLGTAPLDTCHVRHDQVGQGAAELVADHFGLRLWEGARPPRSNPSPLPSWTKLGLDPEKRRALDQLTNHTTPGRVPSGTVLRSAKEGT